jgi:Tol biopolymer transport system component/tRNA A-37 threonylcarbamoyl transferase component Bud32
LSLEPGATVGPYEILGSLGSGGMGVVYRARDTHLHRIVALKAVSDDRLASQAADLLLQEARAASALNHPNICTVHEVRHEAGHVFIVMEYIEGRPLHQQIPPDGMAAETVLLYGAQIADGLAHAHDHGVIHRDIKSANIIVAKNGRAKIVDFGLARRVVQASQEQVTRTNTSFNTTSTVGTLAYMAPEVLQGEQATVASDIWSFGILLFEMSTGHLPFSGRTMFDATAAILKSPLPPLPAHVPAGVRMIIARCLTKQPDQRYHTARELQAALEAVQSGAAIVPVTPRAAAGSFRAWAFAFIAVIAAVGVTLYLWKPTSDRQSSAGQGRLVRVLSSDHQAQDPALSPDGTMIAYVAEDDDGRIDLFAGRVAGGGRIRLTNDTARENRPRFSPDSERIVFARRGADGSGPDVCVVPALGGEVTVIFRGGGHPVFSPDGRRLAFIHYGADGRLSLAIALADGSGVRDLVRATGQQPFIRAPAWSPDGRLITFVQGSGGAAGEIWVVDPGKPSAPRRVSSDPAAVSSDDPSFSADGKMIIHASNRGGATNIWALPVGGGAPVRLTNGAGPDEGPSADAHGRIAFVNARWRNELLMHNLRTRETRPIVRHTPYLWGPAFAPDGGALAFSRGEIDGAWHIWLTDRDGASPHQLTNTDSGEIYPRWAPDGRSLIFHTWATPRRVWQVVRDGGPPKPLTPEGVDAGFGDISPDGKTLAYSATSGGQERLFVIPMGGGPPRAVANRPASLPRWSPDGQWIAFAPDRSYFGGVFVIRPDGSAERRVTKTGGWPAWSHDGRTVGFITIQGDSTQRVELAPLDASAEPETVPIRFSWNNFPFDLSRDGDMLATTNSVHVSTEIWVLETEAPKK